MSPRTGRPLKGQTKRTNSIHMMLDDEEKKMLDSCVKDLGESRTEVIVKGIRLVREKLDKEKK